MTLYKAYVFPGSGDYYLMDAKETGVVIDGVALVKRGTAMLPEDDGWRRTKVEAKRDAHLQIIRQIGEMQAKADALADEILHDDLTTEEVAA